MTPDMFQPYRGHMIPVTTKPSSTRRPSLPKGRTLHLVDVENLLGDPFSSEAAVTEVLERYRRGHLSSGDQVVIAANPHLAVKVKMAWPGAMVRWGRGPDGADNALLAEADPADIARRFERLVIASGDHVFEALIKQVQALGVAVLVVHRPGCLSRHLRRVATSMTLQPASASTQKDAA